MPGKLRMVFLLVAASVFIFSNISSALSHGIDLYKEGELLIKFRPGTPAVEKRSAHARAQAALIKEFPGLGIHHVKLGRRQSVERAIQIYMKNPNVEFAEPNYITTTEGFPTDSRFNEQWALHNIGQTGGTFDADIDAPEAWDLVTGSQGVIIAVIDTGVDYNHVDLAANIWVNDAEATGLPGVDDDANGYVDDIHGIDTASADSDPMDGEYHGTHVAGIIGAAGNNSGGVSGINWNVTILPCKFTGSNGTGTNASAIECLEYVKALKDRGENIIATNNSWGNYTFSYVLRSAIDAQRDILFVSSAGNNGTNNDVKPHYPSGYDLPNVIAVANTDSRDLKAASSNYGKYSVHIGAPGSAILSTRTGNQYISLSGTSMASPHVTGVAGLLKAHDSTLDWKAIRNLILAGGDDNEAMQSRTISGRRLNAYNAVTCTDRPLFSVLKSPESIVATQYETLSALSINCAQPAGPVTVTWSGGQVIDLYDNGFAQDQEAGDGIFTAGWTPPASGGSLTFEGPGGSVSPYGVKITTSQLSDVKLLNAYAQTLVASGGAAPYTWQITGGALPPGLTFDPASALISGIPTSVGRYTFTVKVTDASLMTSTATFSIQVYDLELLTIALGSGQIGVPYQTQLQATGGILPYTWSVKSGIFPPGLTLDAATGSITGTPLTGGVYSFTAEVADSGTESVQRFLSISIIVANGTVWTTEVDGGSRELGVDVAVDSQGNVYTLSTYETSDKDMLLLKHDSSGTVLWSAVYGLSGYLDSPEAVTVDANGNVYVTGYVNHGTGGNNVVILKYDPDGNRLLELIYDSGAYDMGYDVTVDAAGNMYVAGGEAGKWLVLKYGPGGNLLWRQTYRDSILRNIYAHGIEVDTDGNVYVTGELNASTGDDAGLARFSPDGVMLWLNRFDNGLNDSPEGLALTDDGNLLVVGVSNVGTDNGGGQSYVLMVLKYALDGTTVFENTYGQIIGIPAIAADRAGDFYVCSTNYNVYKFDADGTPLWAEPDLVNMRARGIAVDELGYIYISGSINHSTNFNVVTAKIQQDLDLVILTDSLPQGKVGVSYVHQMDAAGGTVPYSWDIVSGTLPGGLGLDGETGVISGTPTAPGTFNLTFQVADASGKLSYKALTLDVRYFRITTGPLVPGITGQSYYQGLAATDGTPPYTWSIASGALPDGLALGSGTGAISGVPASTGTFAFDVQVTDAQAESVSKTFTIDISSGLQVLTDVLPAGISGSAYSAQLEATGGLLPCVWSVDAGSLPDGILLDGSTGIISGVPTSTGTFTFDIRVTDALPASAAKTFSLTVHEKLTLLTAALPLGTTDLAYGTQLDASGGLQPYVWSVDAGSLPSGVLLDSATGIISGAPVSSGIFPVTLRVSDSAGQSDTGGFIIKVFAGTTYYMQTDPGCPDFRNRRRSSFVSLSPDGSNCTVAQSTNRKFGGRSGSRQFEMLVAYLANGGYATDTVVQGLPLGSNISFLNMGTGGTGYVSLVEIDPARRRVVKVLSTISIPLSGAEQGVITDISGLSGLIRAGNTFGVRLSMSSDTRAQNIVSWGQAGGGQGSEQWVSVVELKAPVQPDPLTSPPVADAGPDVTTKRRKTVSFDGSGSSDIDGFIIGYDWSINGKTIYSGKHMTHRFGRPGTYIVTLTVTDDEGATASDEVRVTVTK